MQVSVILNPKSGMQGRHNKSELRIRKILENQDGISFQLIRTEFAAHATELAKESASRGDDICFAAGGDGTMNEVARGLIGSNTSLGIIPLGSGNGLARHLKIPLRIEEAIIYAGASIEIVPLTAGRCFISMVLHINMMT
jgi:diacylglycerol kinase family enzyme